MDELGLSNGELLRYAAVFFVLSQIVLFAARGAIHRSLSSAGQLLAGMFRLVSRACKRSADILALRNREVLMEASRAEMEKRLEREFTRIEAGFARELTRFPDLHCRADKLVTELDADLRRSADSPPEVPGWPEAVKAVVEASKLGDDSAGKALGGMRNMATTAEKRALKDYRDAVSQRHRILARVAPRIRELKITMDKALRAVKTTLEFTSKIDAHMERYEKIRDQDPRTERALASSALVLFLVSTIVLAVAASGAFVNFHLIALPMSELVPSGTRVAGVPVSTVAALVIVLMEAAAGLFVMEALGITGLFPRMDTLTAKQRRLIFVVALLGLFSLATIEASLAFLREQIVEADLALKQSLAGSKDDAVGHAATSSIPVIGQTVLGFILPWILAMIAIPLEMFIQSGRHVGGRLLGILVQAVGVFFRLLSHVARYFFAVCRSLLDIYIAIPLQLGRLMRRKSGDLPAQPSMAGSHKKNTGGDPKRRLA